ncbi:hypothetical protein [Flavobacterium sp. GCM10023249]|jgi:hypothetical protein|uniref:hypothetical protein n=1 Tax=unclassified Flavobacterium TaxID=196869 RepID=UPI003617D5E9
MNKSTKAFIYNLLGFAVFFFPLRYLIATYTHLDGLWIPLTALVVGTILSPKFQAVKTRDGERLFMKWLFTKGLKELK